MGSIGNLNGNSIPGIDPLWQLLETSSQASQVVAVPWGSDQITVSQLAQFFQQLAVLQNTNPTEFKKMAAEEAARLTEAAQQSTDPNQSQLLQGLAAKFQDAAQSGDLSSFDPSASAAQGTPDGAAPDGGSGVSAVSTGATYPTPTYPTPTYPTPTDTVDPSNTTGATNATLSPALSSTATTAGG